VSSIYALLGKTVVKLNLGKTVVKLNVFLLTNGS